MEFARSYSMVSLSLRPEEKLGISMALVPFLNGNGLQGTPYMIRQHATRVLRPLFPRSTPAEIDRLTFYFLARVAASIGKQGAFKGVESMTLEEARTKRDALADAKNSLNELNDQDLFQLQRMMDQKSQLESMISNVMKALSDVQNSLAGNLKAS